MVGHTCSIASDAQPGIGRLFDYASWRLRISQGDVLDPQGSLFAFFANGAELLLKQVSRMETRIWLNVGTVYEKILGYTLSAPTGYRARCRTRWGR